MTTATLERTTFATNRALEFFSEKELQMQIGYAAPLWPVALTKELIDNALDACETTDRAPCITVTVEPDAVTVQDNGPGLPVATLERSLDYLVRVSDKNHYVSPTRGQLGNALKCVWAAPYVASGWGRVEVTTGGLVHQVDVTLDRIAQQPALTRTVYQDGLVKNGTLVKMQWPAIASYLGGGSGAYSYNRGPSAALVVKRYAAFNPHVTFCYSGPDGAFTCPATQPDWQKWRSDNPTSPHWYTTDTLRGLIAAYVGAARDEGGKAKTVREFVAEFRGLAGSANQKRVTDAAGLTGAWLADLVKNGDIDPAPVAALLTAMQEQSRPIKPEALGTLGEEHITAWLTREVPTAVESVAYKRASGMAGGLPYVVEVGFGVFETTGRRRELVIGLNWSPTLRIPLAELDELLQENRVDEWDPVALVVHLAYPCFQWTDRGKGRLVLPPELADALAMAVRSVTKAWKQAKRQADRENRIQQRELDELRKWNRRRVLSVKEAAYRVMAEAYRKASGGTGIANARQIMYAARPLVLALTGGKCWKNSSYFTQHLLSDYIDENPDETAGWDVVYDARGKLLEPHTDYRVDLGTLAVRRYMAGWTSDRFSGSLAFSLPRQIKTCGPANRYSFALFVEKEGFNELLERARIADRFDVAIMSTKGMSVTAARALVGRLSQRDVTVLVLRDFDKAGFSIAHTLRANTRRWRYDARPKVIDLGLRLADVQSMGLQSEPVTYNSKKDPRENLIASGATRDEAAFLVRAGWHGGWEGQRVELNAMTSDQFITWLEGKLRDAGATKVVPPDEVLADAYRRALRIVDIERAIDEAASAYSDEGLTMPADLAEQVRLALDGSSQAWDDVLFDLAAGHDSEAEALL